MWSKLQPERPGLIWKLTELLNFQNKVCGEAGFQQTEKGAEMHSGRKRSPGQKKGKKYACWLQQHCRSLLNWKIYGWNSTANYRRAPGQDKKPDLEMLRRGKWKKNLEEPSRRARMMCILDEIKIAEWYWKETFFQQYCKTVFIATSCLTLRNEQKSCA